MDRFADSDFQLLISDLLSWVPVPDPIRKSVLAGLVFSAIPGKIRTSNKRNEIPLIWDSIKWWFALPRVPYASF